MIESFRHKGLKAFYEDDSTSGVKQDQVKRLRSFSQTRCQFKTSRHGFSWLKITPVTRQSCRISCGDGIGQLAADFSL